MPFDYLKVYSGRRLPFQYVSPAACEGEFSSGMPTIMLLPLLRPSAPTGLVMTVHGLFFRFSWATYPGALCYSIYRAIDEEDPYGPYVLIAECITDEFFDCDGEGWYRVVVITGDGASDPSEPINTDSAGGGGAGGGCVPSVGDPAPENFDIEGEVEWPAFTIDDLRLQEQGYNYVIGDYPPGNYGLAYVAGFRATTIQATADVGAVTDDNTDGGLAICAGLVGGYWSLSSHTPEEIETLAHNALPGHTNSQRRHENDGGNFYAYLATELFALSLTNYPGYPLQLQLIQVDGLIQQPRKLRIMNWDVVKLGFPLDVRETWDGVFSVRETYESEELLWRAPASGGFPGAVVYWTNTHPVAANGRGWMVSITSGGGAWWIGTKEVGDTGVGWYLADVGIPSPGCFEIEELIEE